jgi:hypothetical protein
VNTVQLENLVQRVENSFGEELGFTKQPLDSLECQALQRVFGDQGFQTYLQDQVSRQIIRDYVVNALLLGHLEEAHMATLSRMVATIEGRSALSLQMLMSSVEQASDLLVDEQAGSLKPLRPGPKSPPHIELVRT